MKKKAKHARANAIQIDYAGGIENIKKLFGYNADAAIQAIEKSPPEMKLTLALGLGLPVDLSGYDDKDKGDKPWFSNPFLDDWVMKQLKSRSQSSEDSLVDIYERAPKEISILVSIIIHLLEGR